MLDERITKILTPEEDEEFDVLSTYDTLRV
jgi:hypothetical protein